MPVPKARVTNFLKLDRRTDAVIDCLFSCLDLPLPKLSSISLCEIPRCCSFNYSRLDLFPNRSYFQLFPAVLNFRFSAFSCDFSISQIQKALGGYQRFKYGDESEYVHEGIFFIPRKTKVIFIYSRNINSIDLIFF